MFSWVLGMTSPQKATFFSRGRARPSRAPELATLIITVGTQKMEVTPCSSRYSGSFRGKRNRVSGVRSSRPPQRRVP